MKSIETYDLIEELATRNVLQYNVNLRPAGHYLQTRNQIIKP